MITFKNNIYIAFLGPEGSNSHLAMIQYSKQHFIKNIKEHSCTSFSDIIKLVENNHIDYGILPIENSNSGSICEVYDLLENSHLFLIGEIKIPIKYYILTNNKATLNSIKTIYSHQQSILQCRKLLNLYPTWNIVPCPSTAIAIKKVAKSNLPSIAALGNKYGGIIYGLKMFNLNLNNQQKNITRFVIIASKAIHVPLNQPAKTMITLTTINKSIKQIQKLLNKESNNIKIKYLLFKNTNFSHINTLYIDIYGHIYCTKIQKILTKLNNNTISLKILGCYPRTETFGYL